MRSIILFSTIMLACGALKTQVNNYKAATLITIAGERLEGLANLESDRLMAHTVQFKIGQSGQYRQFDNEDIQRLEIADPVNLIYENVLFEGKNFQTGQMIKEQRLARKLIDGEAVELYRITLQLQEYPNDFSGFPDYMFYLQKDEEIYPLKTTIGADVENTRFIKKSYRGVLKSLFRDLPNAENRIDKLRFKSKPMIDLVYDYLAFQQPEGDFSQKRLVDKKVSAKHGLLLGVVAAQIGGDLPLAGGFLLGYRRDMSDVFQSNAFSLSIGLTLELHNYDELEEREGEEISVLRLISLPAGINYKLSNNTAVKPYIRANISLNYATFKGVNEKFETRGSVFGPARVSLGFSDFSQSTFTVNPGVGVGAIYKKVWVELMYDRQYIPNMDAIFEGFEGVQPVATLTVGYNLN